MSIVICTAFVLAWSPYAVVSMWSACGFQVPNTTSIVTRLFAKSASFYNPLIYFGMSSKFRKEVATLMPCIRRSREVVRLKHFQSLRPRADDGPGAARRAQKAGSKYAVSEPNPPNPYVDQGVTGPPPNLSALAQGAVGGVDGDLPSHIETSQYWCDRL